MKRYPYRQVSYSWDAHQRGVLGVCLPIRRDSLRIDPDGPCRYPESRLFPLPDDARRPH
jgi:hypothetical protein